MDNFSYVIPNELAGMAYPRSLKDLEYLKESGFMSIVYLSEQAPDAISLQPFHHLHQPLPDFALIPNRDIHHVMTFLYHNPHPVVVHCQGGIGRTGVVLACALVTLGCDSQQAIVEIRRKRAGSIDHPALEASVGSYYKYWRDYPLSFGKRPLSPYY